MNKKRFLKNIFLRKKQFIVFLLLVIEIYFIFPFLKNQLLLFKAYILKKIYNHILIIIDVSYGNSVSGPRSFINGINEVLPFFWDKCSFFSSSFINIFSISDILFIPYPRFNEKRFDQFIMDGIINKLILGPIFVPKKWNNFPNPKIWMENRISDILNFTKGVAVHSERVREYLMSRSNTSNNIKKYKIIRPCSNLKPKNINSFIKRKIDILFYEKYADLNRRKQGEQLLNLFKNTSKTIESVKYGSYNKQILNELANNSKFIIYFSFFDTGAIGLKEIQNYGVISFSHQKEFVINKEYSFYIPELANLDNMEIAFNKIMNIINKISKLNVQTELIATQNQMINKCENSLIDLCKSLF